MQGLTYALDSGFSVGGVDKLRKPLARCGARDESRRTGEPGKPFPSAMPGPYLIPSYGIGGGWVSTSHTFVRNGTS